jgi:hypothetical protein
MRKEVILVPLVFMAEVEVKPGENFNVGEFRDKVAGRAYSMDEVRNVKILTPPTLDQLEMWMAEAKRTQPLPAQRKDDGPP